MKSLHEYAEDINKCSKCGLCQSVCPVYKETGNDCAVSRGKFVMLSGVLRGDIKLDKTINKYLDLCLKCGKCKEFCPSDIDVCKIFETAKYEYVQNNKLCKLWWNLQNFAINLIDKFSSAKKNIIFNHGTIKILYFRGCANKIIPNVSQAVKKVLSHYDVTLEEKGFTCCGLPYLSAGNLEAFEQAKIHNLELCKGDYDYILTECASCEAVLKGYGLNNVINIMDFIMQHPKKFVFKKNRKVTFHKPCHLENMDFLKPVLGMCENIEYVEMEGYDDCCGFAGEFALKNNKLSKKLAHKKARNIKATNAEYVLTLCPACTIGLILGGCGKKIYNFVEFLAMAEEVR